jgi:hypothetical protein
VDNCVFDPARASVVEDMTRPLNCYSINSSHNTFLSGDQVGMECKI